MSDYADRPIVNVEQDLLNRQEFIKTLAKALIQEIPATDNTSKMRASKGNVVGLTGEWGSGKSSILNLLADYLGTLRQVVVIRFNPWFFMGREDLLAGFLHELATQISSVSQSGWSELGDLISKYRDALSAAASAWVPSSAPAIAAVNTAVPKSQPNSVSAIKSKLEAKIASLDLTIVVLVDELDRVEDEEVRAVARLIKAIGDIPKISYLVAYDPKRVIEALGRGSGQERIASGEAYLEKLVQLTIPIRPLLDYELASLLKGTLATRGYQLFEESDIDAKKLLSILSSALSTPRDVKRLVESFTALEPMVRGEMNLLDVLGYCFLLTKVPSVREMIGKNPDKVVDDPREIEAIYRVREKNSTTIDKTFGELSASVQEIVKWLFPIFSDPDPTEFDRDRIRKRRNLIRLLYLGNPPHDVPRAELEQIWNSDIAEGELRLRALIASNRLRSVVDRVQDLLPQLQRRPDEPFWIALSKSLVRKHVWATGQEPQRYIVDDIASLLCKAGAQSPSENERARSVVKQLIQHDDLILVPSILRAHVFRYGISGGSPRSSTPVIFSELEVRTLLSDETRRYKAAILSGTVLRYIPDVDLIFLLLNLGQFNSSLRKSLTMELRHRRALATFAALMLPPGYITEQSSLVQLIDTSVVLARVTEVLGTEAFKRMDEWLRGCVIRLDMMLRNGSLYD